MMSRRHDVAASTPAGRAALASCRLPTSVLLAHAARRGSTRTLVDSLVPCAGRDRLVSTRFPGSRQNTWSPELLASLIEQPHAGELLDGSGVPGTFEWDE